MRSVAWMFGSSVLLVVCAALGVAVAQPAPPFWAVGELAGADLGCLNNVAVEHIAFFACAAECAPIPWQLDERDADGRLVLTQGPQPNFDEPRDVVDDNDEVRWMISDAGRQMQPAEIPRGATCGVEVAVSVPASGWSGWVYGLVFTDAASRSPRSYVHYDPARDIVTGARVSLGFQGATPQYLGWHDGADSSEVNLLDRLKVRATARFLGIIPMGRDEGDLSTEFVAWQAGPIRVVRRQRQWIRLGWGIHSPTFGSDTYFYRDFAELPVQLRLNFPPTYFFYPITVRAVLDFRDLRGWRLAAPGLPRPVPVGQLDQTTIERLNQLPGDWFALIGPGVTLVETLGVSPSLATVERHLLYREQTKEDQPEAVPGEMPGVGYQLTNWNAVGSGLHWFSSTSYALPPGVDPAQFVAELQQPIVIEPRVFVVPH